MHNKHKTSFITKAATALLVPVLLLTCFTTACSTASGVATNNLIDPTATMQDQPGYGKKHSNIDSASFSSEYMQINYGEGVKDKAAQKLSETEKIAEVPLTLVPFDFMQERQLLELVLQGGTVRSIIANPKSPSELGPVLTKEDIRRQIENLEKEGIDYSDSYLDSLKMQLEHAPETAPILSLDEVAAAAGLTGFYADIPSGKWPDSYAYADVSAGNSSFNFSRMASPSTMGYYNRNMGRPYKQGEQVKGMDMGYDQALVKAMEIVAFAKGDLQLVGVSVAPYVGEGSGEREALCFTFSHMLEGLPLSQGGLIPNQEYISRDKLINLNPDTPVELESKIDVYFCETLDICIDDDGYALVDWRGRSAPDSPGDKQTMADMQTVLDSFEQHMQEYRRGNEQYPYAADITEIRLSYSAQPDGNGVEGSCKAVPVWDFIGTEELAELRQAYQEIGAFGDYNDIQPYTIKRVSALDGSIVHNSYSY